MGSTTVLPHPRPDPTIRLDTSFPNFENIDVWHITSQRPDGSQQELPYLQISDSAGSSSSKQTRVFKVISDDPKIAPIAKDIWARSALRSECREGMLSKKARTCPGVIQSWRSERIKGTDGKPLQVCYEDREEGEEVPCVLEKWRHFFMTEGESLKGCESVLEILKTLFDALQGQCSCLESAKRSL